MSRTGFSSLGSGLLAAFGDSRLFPFSWLMAILCSMVGNIMWGLCRKGKLLVVEPGVLKRFWIWWEKGGWRKGLPGANLFGKCEK